MGSRGAGNTIAASNMNEVVLCDPTTGVPYSASGGGLTPYASPDGRNVQVASNMAILLTDDFGPTLDTAVRWDVLDGGLGANPTLHGKSLVQGAIGTGVAMGGAQALTNGTTNTALSMAATASALTVTMGVTNNAELWLLSQQAFAGAEDLLVIGSKTQSQTTNDIFIGLVEVDPTTLIPLLNPNLAAQFTNMGGLQLGLTATGTAYTTQAIGDSSTAISTGSTATAIAALTITSEFIVEFHAEDVIASNATVDSAIAKSATPSRVSTQVPNDGKVYKLLMRFRNIGTPALSNVVTINRIAVVDSQELRVEVASGRGDSNGQKGVAVNVATQGAMVASQAMVGYIGIAANATTNYSPTAHKLISAATTNATSVKVTAGRVFGGALANTAATWRYFKIFNKASAPTVGTDTPVLTVGLPPGATVALSAALAADIGYFLSTGIAYAITGAVADLDATAIAAGDVVVALLYA